MKKKDIKSRVLKNITIITLGIFVLTKPVLAGSRDTLSNKTDYPDLITIATVFAQNIDIQYFREIGFNNFQFIHDPIGWWITPSGHPCPPKEKIKIWSADSGYAENINPGKQDREIFLADYISTEDIYNFQIHPFYGYRGWMEDVIIYSENHQPHELSDNSLYGLGRAYSQMAADIFWPHSLFSNPENMKGLEAGRRDLKKFSKLSQEAFSVYRILIGRNPDYKTKVGNIHLKYANEILARFYELSLFGHEKEAKRLLRKTDALNLYGDYWINYARKVLKDLEPNAILFTNGDNDTYPLLLVQHTEDFRKDVCIINLSLLNDPLYLNLVNKNLGHADLFPGMNESDFLKIADKLIYFEPMGQQAHEYSCLANLEKIKLQLDINSSQLTLPEGKCFIPFIAQDGLIDSLIFMNGINGNVLSFAEFFVQGLLYFHAGKTPVYFIKGMQPVFRKMIISDHLIDHGFAYRIEKPDRNLLYFGDQFYDRLSLEKLTQYNLTSVAGKSDFSETLVSHLFLEAETVLIYNLQEAHSISLRMKDFLLRYPPQSFGINQYYLFIADDLYNSGEFPEFAKEAINGFIRALEMKIRDVKVMELTPWNIQEMNYLSYMLSLFGESYYLENNPDLQEIIRAYENIISTRLLKLPQISLE